MDGFTIEIYYDAPSYKRKKYIHVISTLYLIHIYQKYLPTKL
jgi:hypothetical protein